jgi:signal transduction histidine kinase/CheY-like chemotaxis protein/purine-cytosine permease-like protein
VAAGVARSRECSRESPQPRSAAQTPGALLASRALAEQGDESLGTIATQRIVKVRRDYNTWVADETLEDYALRFTPRSFRKWSEWRVANTAIGAISFLALEAIGGAITLRYGFENALWAVLVVGVVIFATGLPITYYAAKYGVDMDLLTRGAGFGYLGSTVTSLIYASFTFIFFAIEAAIMALALQLYFALPLWLGYLISSLAIIPLVMYGITLISRLQLWTQPIWIAMMLAPFIAVLIKSPESFARFASFSGHEGGDGFNWLAFGAAATVAFSLIAQIGEQVDFLRFLPEKTAANRRRWWAAVLVAGPGWILLGMAKMAGGAFLAFLALQHEIDIDRAMEPTQMYLVGYGYVFADPALALAATALFVIVSQVKINVTNAYAGSLAWSNFFARLTHSHPGRVVWLVFNVLIAVVLMVLGVFDALEHVLGVYSNVAIAWVGALVSDLVVNKPLGLSPRHIEFKRAHLYDVNPVGVGAMLIASILGMAAYGGAFGAVLQAFSPFVALVVAFVAAPAIAVATRSRWYIARDHRSGWTAGTPVRCVICEHRFEAEDMAHCPTYGGAICSLCCTIDARCQDRCKDGARISDQTLAVLRTLLPPSLARLVTLRVGQYVVVLVSAAVLLAALLASVYYQELVSANEAAAALRVAFLKLYGVLMVIVAAGAWWIVLGHESRLVAQEESSRQTQLLMREIDAHRETDAALQRAKEAADAANHAKSRYVTGISHELRTPLNSILGYAQLLSRDAAIPAHRRDAIGVMRRSGEHLLSLIDGLLDIARIEAGKLRLDSAELRLPEFLDDVVRMFRPQAEAKGLAFHFEAHGALPAVVHADAKRLRQILINLLGNAVKFTDAGTITLRVAYRLELAHIDVIDTGLGIAPEDIERIFLPFERSGATRFRDEPGTGLGLTIARLLTDLMGGDLAVTSVPGAGSTFRTRLYLPTVAVPTAVARAQRDIAGYEGRPRTLLVVDDQAPQRALLAAMLAPLGFRVIEAASGEECLRAVAVQAPDAVLLDVAMPGIDGWETCRRLRAAPHAGLAILMLSANAFDNVSARKAEAGCSEFIVKPVIESELFAALERHLRIEWTYVSAAGVEPRTDRVALKWPSADVLGELRRLGEIGYVKGIHRKLDELETDGRYADCARVLREMVMRFRLDDYARVLAARLDEHA